LKHEHKHPSIAIIGLGNLLMCDDGVGVHAIKELEKDPPEDVVLADVGTAALHCQHLFEDADEIIAIDAVCAGDKPGAIYSFDGIDAQLNHQTTLHDLGLRALIELIPEESRPHVTILGVEPEKLEYGMELSKTVSSVLPQVVKRAKKMAGQIRQQHIKQIQIEARA
jgi:hydrogenase maturation protease